MVRTFLNVISFVSIRNAVFVFIVLSVCAFFT